MNLISLTETLVKSVVSQPELVRVKEFETEEDNFVLIQVMVDKDDMGKVIGRKGRIANSIRNIVQASGHSVGKKVKINIDSF